jgi:heme a synthase
VSAVARRRVFVRRIALGAAALMFAVTTLNAFVRLANVSLGGAPETEAMLMARDAHSTAAMIVLLCIVAIAAVSLGPRPYLAREGKHALALIGLAVFLAVTGRISGGVVTLPFVFGNVFAGFLLFALCWRLAFAEPRVLAPGQERLAWLAVAAVVLQLALGTLYFMAGYASGMALAHYVISLLLFALLLQRVRLPWLDEAPATDPIGPPPAIRSR